MRKYFVAAVVAVMVFAFAAFAASLQVNGGVLQAGQATDLTCADSATVGYQTLVDGSGAFAVNQITVTFAGAGDCDGNFAYLAIFDHDPTEAGGANIIGFGIRSISDNKAVFNIDNAPAEDIESVSVAVKNTDDSGVGFFSSGIVIPGP